MKVELKPCPFCGGEAAIESKGTARQSMVIVCENCGAVVESGDVHGMTPPSNYKWNRRYDAARTDEWTDKPQDVVLFCPKCKEQHIDKAEPDVCELCGDDQKTHGTNRDVGILCDVFTPWLNRPHKKHRCHSCNHVWRAAAFPTNGVAEIPDKQTAEASEVSTEAEQIAEHCRVHKITHHSINADGSCNMGCC